MQRQVVLVFLLEFAAAPCLLPQSWVAQGPGPTLNGQTEGIGDNPVSGAINAIAVGASPDILYAGAVNGGVWKTTNATFSRPAWTPLTDLKLPALSVNSLAVSPTDGDTLFVGTGNTSSIGTGSPGVGVAKSTDGGVSWKVLAGRTFSGKAINSIVPTMSMASGQVVLAATLDKQGGVYRSTDGGDTFIRISGSPGSGLPDAGASNLVADPGSDERFYAAVPSGSLGAGTPGIYVSADVGATWTLASREIPEDILNSSSRVLLSVSRASPNPVYAMFIADENGEVGDGHLSGVFRSADHGVTWVSMGLPPSEIFPGGQGGIHGAIAAHPANANVVWIAGDRQELPESDDEREDVVNENGCRDFSANVMRGNLLQADPGSGRDVWSNGVCDGAHGTSPHADVRAMVFDQDGNLLQGNDGGLSRLENPESSRSRKWVDVNGNIQPTEIHSIAYDSVSSVLLAGTQDTGTPIQSAPGSTIWDEFSLGDGAVVAVDADQTRHPGISIRYTSNEQLSGFTRSFWDVQGMLLDHSSIALVIISGQGRGQQLSRFDPAIPFYAPYALNRIDPSRMLLGTCFLYESFDRGDTLTNLGSAGTSPDPGTPCQGAVSAIAYGGRFGGVANSQVFYAATGSVSQEPPGEDESRARAGVARDIDDAESTSRGTIFHRTASGGDFTKLTSYPGGPVRSLAVDPENFKRVFAVDVASHVWGSFDEGATWMELTKELNELTSTVWSVEVFSTDAGGTNTVLLAGTFTGVFQMRNPGESAEWSQLGTGLPHAPAYVIHYDYEDHVLVAGTLGRGAWLLDNPFSQLQTANGRSRARQPRISTGPVRPLTPSQPPRAAPGRR